MSARQLTIEDVLAAARCVALWQRVGARPLTMARAIREASLEAADHYAVHGRAHPQLGDGSVMAAAARLRPGAAAPETPITMPELLRALAPVSLALGSVAGRTR